MSKQSPVRTQMPAHSSSGSHKGPGVYDANTAPFDKPHDTGNGGIPLKFFDRPVANKTKGPFPAPRQPNVK